MTEWLDDLVSKTKQHYEDQKAKEATFLEEQRLKKALGKVFFKDLRDGLKTYAEKFNKKFGSEVFSVEDDGLPDEFIISSKPDQKHKWTATVTYGSDAHRIEINRSPGGSQAFSLSLVSDRGSIVALYGNSTDVEKGQSAEKLGQNIMASMLLTP
jgi:hypothetical protein